MRRSPGAAGRRTRAVLAGALLVLAPLLAACAGEQDGGLLAASPSRVEVDTPELQRLRAEAGIEPCRAPAPADPVEGGMPELTLDCLGGGEPVELSALRGPAVVQVWASWCRPCRDELPLFEAFHDQHGDRVQVLGVNTQDPMPRRALELLDETGATFPHVADPGADLTAVDGLPVRALPGLVLLDAEGRVVYRELREVTSLGQLEQLVTDELGVRL